MHRVGLAARAALARIVLRLVKGERLTPEDREGLDGVLPLLGYRDTLRFAVMRLFAGGAARQAETVIAAPVLGGAFRLAIAADDPSVGLQILALGDYEPHVAAFYRRALRPGMTVLDVGANIGFHALHAAHRVGPGGKVHAVEPDPRNAALIRASLALAEGPLPVEVIEAALSDAEADLVLSDLGNRVNSGARFVHRDRERLEGLVHGPAPEFRTVRAHRWDDLRPDARVDLVKIDVEGHEPQVLRGMETTLARHAPVLVMEFAPSNLRQLGGTEPGALLAWLRERRYTASVLEEDGVTTPAPTETGLLARLGDRHHLDLVFTAGR